MLRKPLASYKKVNSKQTYRAKNLKNRRSKAGGEREQSGQNVKWDATRVPGVLEGRAWPCSVPNSISLIASVIRPDLPARQNAKKEDQCFEKSIEKSLEKVQNN